MSFGILLAVILCVIGTIGSGLFSGAETGAYQFNRTRHRLRVAEGGRSALLVQRMTSNLTGFLVVCLVGTNLSNSLVSYSATLAWSDAGFGTPELLSTLTVAPVLFILGELAPKELFRRHADRLLYSAAPILRLSEMLLWPVARTLGLITHALHLIGLRGEDDSFGREERLRQAIAAGMEGGTLTAYQGYVARNIFSLRMRRVRHAMIPIDRVDALDSESSLEQARSEARSIGRGRYPVYQGRKAEVVGVIDLYDLVFEERGALADYVRPVHRISPDEKVAEALVRMRRERALLAVVARGERVLGIVTLKDLVEEITGELQDM